MVQKPCYHFKDAANKLNLWSCFLILIKVAVIQKRNKMYIFVTLISKDQDLKKDLGFVWLEECKNGMMKNCGRMEKWEDGKYLIFPLVCLVGGVEN